MPFFLHPESDLFVTEVFSLSMALTRRWDGGPRTHSARLTYPPETRPRGSCEHCKTLRIPFLKPRLAQGPSSGDRVPFPNTDRPTA